MKSAAQYTLIFILFLVGCSEPTPEKQQRDSEDELFEKVEAYFNTQVKLDDEVLTFDNLKIDSIGTLNSRILLEHKSLDILIQAAIDDDASYDSLMERIQNTTQDDDIGTVAYVSLDFSKSDGTRQHSVLRVLFDKNQDLRKEWNYTKD